MKKAFGKSTFHACIGLWLAMVVFSGFAAIVPPGANLAPGPRPGDVYKEYPFTINVWQFGKKPHSIDIDDLKDATRAELGVEYWGGHIGTSEQRLVINGHANKAVHYALPQNTPTRPECYHHQTWGNAATEIPLSILKQGSNTFEFKHSKQICYSWNWPQTLTYGLIFRVYYKSTKPHPTGSITSPKSGAVLGESATISASTQGATATYFVGHFEDFDWEGDGQFRQWHWSTHLTKMQDYIGISSGNTPRVTWKTRDVPDQKEGMKIAAILVDNKGYRYMTLAVENITLKRTKSVSLFKPVQVPEFFCVREGRTKKSCLIKLTRDIKKATKIELMLSTWSCAAWHKKDGKWIVDSTSIYINGKRLLAGFGKFHAPSMDIFTIPQSFFKAGVNMCSFEVRSTTKEHACEINWPGPILRAHFDEADTPIKSATPYYGPRGSSRLHMNTLKGGFAYRVQDKAPYRFEVIDLQGKRLKSIHGVGPATGMEKLESGEWANGIYFGTLVSGHRSLQCKFVKTGK